MTTVPICAQGDLPLLRVATSTMFGRCIVVPVPPYPSCSFNCVYCQYGDVAWRRVRRRRYFEPGRAVEEILELKDRYGSLEHVLLTGMGDPTQFTGLGDLLRRIAIRTGLAAVVRSHGALLSRPSIRDALARSSMVVLAVDAADRAIFQKINRPRRGLTYRRYRDGLIGFSKEYQGELWIESTIVAQMNDHTPHLKQLRRFFSELSPSRILLELHGADSSESGEWGTEIRRLLGGATWEVSSVSKVEPNISSTGDFPREQQGSSCHDPLGAPLEHTRYSRRRAVLVQRRIISSFPSSHPVHKPMKTAEEPGV